MTQSPYKSAQDAAGKDRMKRYSEEDLSSNQIVGYIMSGDPTYITSHKRARSLIMKVERDELVEEILESYIRNNHWNEEV